MSDGSLSVPRHRVSVPSGRWDCRVFPWGAGRFEETIDRWTCQSTSLDSLRNEAVYLPHLQVSIIYMHAGTTVLLDVFLHGD